MNEVKGNDTKCMCLRLKPSKPYGLNCKQVFWLTWYEERSLPVFKDSDCSCSPLSFLWSWKEQDYSGGTAAEYSQGEITALPLSRLKNEMCLQK